MYSYHFFTKTNVNCVDRGIAKRSISSEINAIHNARGTLMRVESKPTEIGNL